MKRVAVVLVGVILTFAVLEAALGAFVTYAMGQARLVERDAMTGWRVRPHLDVTRRNSAGEPWRIQTNACRLRGPCDWSPDASRRVLVLGDSFAFGEGVSFEERFDAILADTEPGLSFVNAGVMGYGTDQEILTSRALVGRLHRGDTVVLLVHGTDFVDILRQRFAARAKPWFQKTSRGLVEHPPVFGWNDVARDRLYTAALIARLTERDSSGVTVEQVANVSGSPITRVGDAVPPGCGHGLPEPR